MKIGDIYANGRFALSFEVFPPKTEQGLEPMFRSVEALTKYRPGFISCTYGAGGSTRDQTLDIVTRIRSRWNISTTAHFTCVGSTIADIRGWLGRAKDLGVENIMALRGDPPQGQKSFQAVEGGLRYASELVALIKKEFPNFGMGVAGYPETHQDALNPESDLENLKRKIDAGGDAVFTQLFYDNVDFFRFRDQCEKIGIHAPIIPGILPVLSLAQVQRITSLCKAKLPETLLEKLRACGDDANRQIDVGVEHASMQCAGLLREGVAGIHFYVLNRSEPTCRILENVAELLPTS
ncbi:MAG: methylenetetrahydrofolate reductase [NAD(P)H] [Planctomycetota bacterium]